VIVGSVKSENEGEHDPTKIAASACQPRNNSVICRMNVRNDGKIRTVTCVCENGAYGNGCDKRMNVDVRNKADNS
jgi:hypothetical protein